MFCRVVKVIFYFKEKGEKMFNDMYITKSRTKGFILLQLKNLSYANLFKSVISKRFCSVSESAKGKVCDHKEPINFQ